MTNARAWTHRSTYPETPLPTGARHGTVRKDTP